MQILEREGEENEALHKMMASEQKTSLQNLFHDKCRPCLGSWPQVWEGGQLGEHSRAWERFLLAFIPLSKKFYFTCERGCLIIIHSVQVRLCLRWEACASRAYTCVVPRCDFPRLAVLAQSPAKDTREWLVCQHSCCWPGVS